MKKVPLLHLLQDRYPEYSKKELHAFILCGEVRVEGERLQDPKRLVRFDAEALLIGEERRFVSRGGEKLEAALLRWKLPVEGRVWLDAGASTGGFTDCLLRYGAKKVHAVDVGYNQIDYRLRRDGRVTVYERTNIMTLQSLEPAPEAACADLSFRSLRGAAAHLLSLTTEGIVIALAKPQFETPRLRDDGFDGLIRTPEEVGDILKLLVSALSGEGAVTRAVIPSPIPGRMGNREFLLLLHNGGGGRVADEELYLAAEEAFSAS